MAVATGQVMCFFSMYIACLALETLQAFEGYSPDLRVVIDWALILGRQCFVAFAAHTIGTQHHFAKSDVALIQVILVELEEMDLYYLVVQVVEVEIMKTKQVVALVVLVHNLMSLQEQVV